MTSTAALLADRPDVAGLVSQLHDIDAPISDKAADALEALAAQLEVVTQRFRDSLAQRNVLLGALQDSERELAEQYAEIAKLKGHAEKMAHYTDCYAIKFPDSGANYILAEYRRDYPKDAP